MAALVGSLTHLRSALLMCDLTHTTGDSCLLSKAEGDLWDLPVTVVPQASPGTFSRRCGARGPRRPRPANILLAKASHVVSPASQGRGNALRGAGAALRGHMDTGVENRASNAVGLTHAASVGVAA